MIQPSRLFILLLCIYLLRVCVSCALYCLILIDFVGSENDIFVIFKPVCFVIKE